VFLHQSNRLETLLRQFHTIIREPLADPLAPEVVVVHNQGMAQWVSQQLAFSAGIAAHLRFPLPARFIWETLQSLAGAAPEEDRFARAALRWRVAGLLPPLLDRPAFREIAAYLRDDREGNKLHQLSGRISDVFDQYLVYRPDLLNRWEQGEETHWQAALWRILAAEAVPHRARLTKQCQLLLGSEGVIEASLPQRCHLFGLNSLAPVYLEFIEQISRRIEVHLFHLSPCRHYWGDLVSARQLAGKRAKKQQSAAAGIDSYYEQGHPLLVALGTTGQDFFRQLLDRDVQENDLYEENEQTHLLATLHNDILDLRDRSAADQERFPLHPDDRSVQFHCCFSPLREIQVLHDRLLDLFQQIPDLTPGDILVSAPDMQLYADAVGGVFGEAHQERRIPWSIADLSLTREQPLVRCFIDLLDLLSGRFTAPEVLALCETPALLRRFDLDPAILPRLHSWVRDAGICWGLDEPHRRELAVEAGDLHSWQFGLDRLLLGYLMGDCSQPQAGRLPYGHLVGGEAGELGSFAGLIDTLAQWRRRVGPSRPPDEWCADLLRLPADFFDPEEDDQGLQSLREAVNSLKSDCRLAGYAAPLSFAVVRQHLESVLAQPDGGHAFLSGRVTFSNMVPMRSVPFRVVCLLGMNDQDFPRCQHPVAFDLMAGSPRLGDRNRRNDDRYLFLEALLSARDVFYLSWVGRNLRDDCTLPPSVVVSELREYLEQSCLFTGASVCDHLTTAHPMQPFSPRCFDGTAATAGYNPAWLPADRVSDTPPFLRAPLEPPGPEWRVVDVRRLVRFWRHPVRFFLERIIGLRLGNEEAGVEENEPFTLDHLQLYHLRRETVDDLLCGRPEEEIRCGLEASGRLPQGGFGRSQFAGIATISRNFADQLRPLLAHPLPPLEIDRTIGPFRLTGWLTDLYRDGRVTWHSGMLKGANLIDVWLHHLILNLVKPPGLVLSSIHLTRNSAQADKPVARTILRPVAEPEPCLHRLLDFYWQGLSQPLPFFPETSLAWARTTQTGKKEDNAYRAWVSSFQHTGEGGNPAYSYFFSPDELPLTPSFVELADLFLPILAHLEDDCAAA
jgi:exodeoxyribonuclease V gamma subunit